MIVLDASAAVGIVLGTREGLALRTLVLEGEEAVAPTLYVSEVANTLRKYVRNGKMEAVDAGCKLQEALALVDELADDGALAAEALLEASDKGHSVYDMFYLVLARRARATLFTLDGKLRELCVSSGVDCVHLLEI